MPAPTFEKVKPVIRFVGFTPYSFRSTAEYHHALHLEAERKAGRIKSWYYEDTQFCFFPKGKSKYRKRIRSIKYMRFSVTSVNRNSKIKIYIPDFRVVLSDGTEEFHEVKGKWTVRARTAIANMKKHFPKVRLRVIKSNNIKVKR